MTDDDVLVGHADKLLLAPERDAALTTAAVACFAGSDGSLLVTDDDDVLVGHADTLLLAPGRSAAVTAAASSTASTTAAGADGLRGVSVATSSVVALAASAPVTSGSAAGAVFVLLLGKETCKGAAPAIVVI